MRRSDLEQGGERLDAGLISRDRSAGGTRGGRVGASQIGTDLLPRVAVVRRLPQLLRSRIQHVGIVVRKDDGECPLHALGEILRRLAHRILRPDVDHPQGTVRVVVPAETAAVAPRKEDVRIGPAVGHVAALTSPYGNEEIRGAGCPR